jgi:UDP-N-acetylmuramoyl-L-alanyl-D-glutamate--2,6-diaminopimelate ligase
MTARPSAGAEQAVRSSSVASFPSVRPLSDLLADLRDHEVHGDPGTHVQALCYRSDEAAPGSLFFCVPGDRVDGHDFADDAVARGAVVLVVERRLASAAVQVVVPSVRAAMGPISAAFFEHPADRMTVVGVTGTNGKTTTTYLLEAIFRAAGWTPGVIGTTGIRIDGRPAPFPRTTPEAPDLHRLLAEMADKGIEAVAMEVSSHGLDQERVGGVRYSVAVFTNLSQDHLDYHPSMEEYFEAKARLFTPEVSDRAVVNRDSEEGRRLAGRIPTLTFGTRAGADVRATEVEATTRGIDFRIGGVKIHSSLRGLFNVENCLAAFATARALGIEDRVAAEAIASVEGVPGRVEAVEAGQDFLVLVDYAHTPDGVENVLRAARRLSSGRLVVVLGCGGDRDRAKRPLMGRAATANADLAVITSDNPRSEDPSTIIAEMGPGAKAGGGAYLIEPDRRSAIRIAVRAAGPGDVVVIAGKGHEAYQEFADRTIPFDDRAVAAEELRALHEAAT